MTSRPHTPDETVRIDRIATGGEGVARLGDGRVVFVGGALPGELVVVSVTENKKRFARGVAREIVEPGPARRALSCRHAGAGQCGGCDWQHVEPPIQLDLKREIVAEQLFRLGGLDSAEVISSAPVAAPGGSGRTTVRCAVTAGRAGFRARRSDRGFVADECPAAHPLVEELIVEGRFGAADEVVVRVGALTGDRLVITDGPVSEVLVPSDVTVASERDAARVAITDVVAGRSWRISGASFFQTSHGGAEALVAAVTRALVGSEGSVVDLYAGVGLLGGSTVIERLACAVESNPSSVADANHNLGPDVRVERGRVERWQPRRFGTVIADPARRGLGADAVAVVEGTGATSLVLVSCDPAALGRDTALLIEQGWRHQQSEVVDMFPDTSRIEVVTGFSR